MNGTNDNTNDNTTPAIIPAIAPRIVYMTGYGGQHYKDPRSRTKAAALKQTVEAMDAVLFDIRFSPKSPAPCWQKKNLRELLGDRYRHVPSLGNKNYNNGREIEIVDMAAGVAEILEILACEKRVLLMCGCEDPMSCHRCTIACYLRDYVRPVRSVREVTNWGLHPQLLQERIHRAETEIALPFIGQLGKIDW